VTRIASHCHVRVREESAFSSQVREQTAINIGVRMIFVIRLGELAVLRNHRLMGRE
jgi:hypothetical protein